ARPGRRAAVAAREADAQHAHYLRAYPGADLAIVELAGAPVGRLYVHRRADELRLLDVTLLPEHRGRGIGTRLVRALLDEARARGVAVSCDVEHDNHRARALYLGLGFEPVFEDPVCTLLSWVPPAE